MWLKDTNLQINHLSCLNKARWDRYQAELGNLTGCGGGAADRLGFSGFLMCTCFCHQVSRKQVKYCKYFMQRLCGKTPPTWLSPIPSLLCSLFLCAASYFLSIVLAPSSTCSTVQWLTLNLFTGTPLSPSPASLPGTDPSERQSGCVAPPPPLLPDTRQGPVPRQRPQLGHRQRSVIIK